LQNPAPLQVAENMATGLIDIGGQQPEPNTLYP